MNATDQHRSIPHSIVTNQHGSTPDGKTRRPMPLMPEVAILTTFALIAAPILLVAGTMAAAARKRLTER
jgi:hypothetical protein